MSEKSNAGTSSRHQNEEDYGICNESDTDYIAEHDEDQHYS